MAAAAASASVHRAVGERRDEEPMRHDAMRQQLGLATRRLLAATLRLDEAGLVHPAASGLGTRRHVLARLVRRARRIGMDARTRSTARPSADGLLQCSAAELLAALDAALAAVLTRLHHEPTAPAEHEEPVPCDVEHLAWLELTHVDLAVGYALHDVPDFSQEAIAEHLRRARDGRGAEANDGDAGEDDGASPFSLLFATTDDR